MELRPKHVAIRNVGSSELLPRILDFFTLEEGTDGSSRSVCKELPLYAPQSRTRVRPKSCNCLLHNKGTVACTIFWQVLGSPRNKQQQEEVKKSTQNIGKIKRQKTKKGNDKTGNKGKKGGEIYQQIKCENKGGNNYVKCVSKTSTEKAIWVMQ